MTTRRIIATLLAVSLMTGCGLVRAAGRNIDEVARAGAGAGMDDGARIGDDIARGLARVPLRRPTADRVEELAAAAAKGDDPRLESAVQAALWDVGCEILSTPFRPEPPTVADLLLTAGRSIGVRFVPGEDLQELASEVLDVFTDDDAAEDSADVCAQLERSGI